jgi:hypothetical protein
MFLRNLRNGSTLSVLAMELARRCVALVWGERRLRGGESKEREQGERRGKGRGFPV